MKITFETDQKEYCIFRRISERNGAGKIETTNQPLEQSERKLYIIIGDAFAVYFDGTAAPPDKPVWGTPHFWYIVHIRTGMLVTAEGFTRENAVLCALELWALADWNSLDETYFMTNPANVLTSASSQAREIVTKYLTASRA